MTVARVTQLARHYTLVVGGLDVVSGLGLVMAPARTLRWMRIEAPGTAEAVGYVRFVGALVMALGLVYVWAWVRGGGERLRAVLELTLAFRFAAAVFTGLGVALSWVDKGWLLVTAADVVLVLAQLALLWKGAGQDGA